MENTSGMGRAAVIPPEIQHWNWGAFLLNWIWGVGNSTYIALLCFVPFVGIIMPFVLGAKGNTWAWRNKRWESLEHFQTVQSKWKFWGFIILAILLCVFLLGIVTSLVVPRMLGVSSEVYHMALDHAKNNQEVINILGNQIAPVSSFPGWSGSIEVVGPSGHADIAFAIKGQKGTGTVYVKATKDMGKWNIDRLVIEVDERRQRINFLASNNNRTRRTKEPRATRSEGVLA